MTSPITERIASELRIEPAQVNSTVQLLSDGGTVPFIARYRKEVTGALDEDKIRKIKDLLEYHLELEDRKQTILKTIESQGKLTGLLKQKIDFCMDRAELEDLYLPFRPRKKTKASVARSKGLEPVAEFIWKQEVDAPLIETVAERYVNPENSIENILQVIEGALHIIAEWISENADYRKHVRDNILASGKVISKVVDSSRNQRTKFEMYYDFSEPVREIPSHRLLAIRRGVSEKVLNYSIDLDNAPILDYLEKAIIKDKDSAYAGYLEQCIRDAYTRLIFPSIQTEVFNFLKRRSDEEAIQVFQQNLKNLLLAPPAGPLRIMGIDPGYRTGCKLAVVDETGKFLDHGTIYPHPPANKQEEASRTVLQFIDKYEIQAIAIGNGTASRETDQFVKNVLDNCKDSKIFSVVVSESGASVYSASPLARKEFPDLDVTVRGAISIARRLQDPLAELVKIDPKSIGVGQYQHDVDRKKLKKSLENVVESCVNLVGVDLNTASFSLLKYVAGINESQAKNIVTHRNQHGPFQTRQSLLDTKGFGLKTFEQSAGFLRIKNGIEPLDSTAVHPERYDLVKQIANDMDVSIEQLIQNKELLENLDLDRFIDDNVGKYTLIDIRNELLKPGRDPRNEFKLPKFRVDIKGIEDLEPGMVLEGTITNVTNFGAFVDIGVHQDGLIHVSEIAHQYVKDPRDMVKVGDIVKVKILNVEKELRRIGLSIRAVIPKPQYKSKQHKKQHKKHSHKTLFQEKLDALKKKYSGK